MMKSTILFLLLAAQLLVAQGDQGKLLTVAESSEWRATGLHADVITFVERLA